MSRRLTQKEFIEKAINIHGDKYDYSQTVYVSSRSKLNIICPEHGIFEQRASSHLDGNGCHGCQKIWTEEHKENLRKSSRLSRGMTTEEWIKRAKAVHGDKYDYSKTIYVNQRTKVKIICPEHGEFEQNADSHLNGHGCKICGYLTDGHKFHKPWSDEQREKIRKTCLERYGAERYLDSKEGRQKLKSIKSDPVFRKKMRDIVLSDKKHFEEYYEKSRKTCLEKYGTEYYQQSSEYQERLNDILIKSTNTKKKNGTINTSKVEKLMYQQLCDIFGKDDVISQYRDVKRYPFQCDFYIKSRDLFIELNLNWTHGKHWYNPNDQKDINKLDEWKLKSKTSKYYANAIETWVERDVLKRKTASEFNLNYLTFWKSDLSDFNVWIDAGCPDGHDYDEIYSWQKEAIVNV